MGFLDISLRFILLVTVAVFVSPAFREDAAITISEAKIVQLPASISKLAERMATVETRIGGLLSMARIRHEDKEYPCW